MIITVIQATTMPEIDLETSEKSIKIRRTINAIIAAINKPDGKFVFNPKSPSTIEAGDRLIALGERRSLIELNKLCSGD
jgi:K+/H+ antiporter YhaU regulatory subunit KhtT